ncbi:MAG: hypothetical protein J6X20_05065, partial [Bacteroidales bacterium]|nr:hypothetical protein [Bacteroidales bacterium]
MMARRLTSMSIKAVNKPIHARMVLKLTVGKAFNATGNRQKSVSSNVMIICNVFFIPLDFNRDNRTYVRRLQNYL